MADDKGKENAVPPVEPVEPVEPVSRNLAESEHGVPPLGQTEEWRDRVVAREAAHKVRGDVLDEDKPDLLLDIPDISVEEISFELDNLRAHVSLDAKVARLVTLSVGADISIDRVKLLIKGVHAEALLKVRLKRVAQIVDRVFTTIDRNPQLITQLISALEKTVTTVGEVATTALAPGGLLSQTVNVLGQTVNHVVDTTGRILEQTLNPEGQPVETRQVGDLGTMRQISRTSDAAGNVTYEVLNEAGEILRYTIDTVGTVTDVRVVGHASERQLEYRP